MRMLATPGNWPPTFLDEVAALLGKVPYPSVGSTPDSDTEYVLTTALAEIDEWLEIRPNEKQQPPGDRESMLNDFQGAMKTRGPAVRECTPSAEALMTLMETLLNPPSQADPADAAEQLANLRAELIDPGTASAAFDDLLVVVQDPVSSPSTIARYISILTGVLALSDRGVAEVCHLVGGVVDDQAIEINYVRHVLDDTAIEDFERPDDLAGLTVDDRLELCRRYLQRPAEDGHHIVWIAYEHARVATATDWYERVGPVEFFDGPSMVEGINNPTTVRGPERLPPELTIDREKSHLDREPPWPRGDVRWWVAARVDLGPGHFSDPVAIGRAQADGIVQLAICQHTPESTWRPLGGFIHLLDGRQRSSSPFHVIDSMGDVMAEYDETADAFQRLAPQIGPHLPIVSATLRRLLEAVETLNTSGKWNGADLLTAHVRVIEFISRQSRNPPWNDFLFDNGKFIYASNRIHNEIYQAVDEVINTITFRDHDRGELRKRIRTHTSGNGVRVDIGAALELGPELLASLPAHHASSRRLRELVRRTQGVDDLNKWADDLVGVYKTKVRRLARFRNALTHGAAAKLEIAHTIRKFSHTQASLFARRALKATLEGQTITDAFADLRRRGKTWRQRIRDAKSDVGTALFTDRQ